ncbi:hypothetical protein [Borreliella kurtenbachii]|uniref:hypothetical protein n=1 Tax=Borreliella kurtenbachii TaxID=1196056 RepID=UPI0034630A99
MINSIDKAEPSDQKSFKAFFPAIREENELTNKVKEKQILSYLKILLITQIQKIIMNIY